MQCRIEWTGKGSMTGERMVNFGHVREVQGVDVTNIEKVVLAAAVTNPMTTTSVEVDHNGDKEDVRL